MFCSPERNFEDPRTHVFNRRFNDGSIKLVTKQYIEIDVELPLEIGTVFIADVKFKCTSEDPDVF